jgi:hypothetical protein
VYYVLNNNNMHWKQWKGRSKCHTYKKKKSFKSQLHRELEERKENLDGKGKMGKLIINKFKSHLKINV